MIDVNIQPMDEQHMDAVLKMWHRLLKMTAEVNPRYRISSDAVEIQRQFFIRHEDNDSTYCYVALHGNEPVGFANGYLIMPTRIFIQKPIGLIENLFVYSKYRRQGVGKKLVDQCYRWFYQLNVKEVYVNVIPANELSVRFWESQGYAIHKQTMARTLG